MAALFDQFKAQKFTDTEAAVKAKQQFKAEQENKASEIKKGVPITSAAVGQATNARSVDASLKRQKRIEDQAAKQLQTSIDSAKDSLLEISEAITSFNLGTA